MLNRFKDWLGIEGVKLELLVPEEVDKAGGFVDGRLVFTSKNSQTISEVEVLLLEKYIRGRGTDVKIDEYELGRITLAEPFRVPAYQEIYVDFELPFILEHSGVDAFGEKNILARGLAKAAKAYQKVKSEYRVLAKAKVKGTALDPFSEQVVRLK